MATEIFVDTGAWCAVLEPSDNKHVAAAKAFPRLLSDYQRLVTTNLVIAEVYILLRRHSGHDIAIKFLEQTRSSPRLARVFSVPELEIQAEEILRRYRDQTFSYTDAVSFAVMKARGIKEAFAFDKHFAAAGFQLVPAYSI